MKTNTYITLARYLPALTWMILIFTLSSIPKLPSPANPVYDYALKKMAHMFVYGMLYTLLWYASKNRTKSYAVLIFGICVMYGFSDELHQSFVPGRTPHIMDLGYDSVGVSIMRVITTWLKK